MAGAVSLKGFLGASLSIKGPGLTNALPGIANNFFENRPALSISERFEDGSEKAHKRVDHDALLRPLVKARGRQGSDLEVLWHRARIEPCGPVHQDLCEGGEIVVEADPYRLDPDDYRKSKRPSILLGGAALRKGVDFSGVNVPVFTTATAKGLLDESLPQSAGVFTGVGLENTCEPMTVAGDCVICVQVYDHELLSPPPRAKHITLNGVDELLSFLDGKEWGLPVIEKTKRQLSEFNMDAWLPYQAFDHLSALPWHHDVVVDVGLFSVVGEHVWRASPDRGFYGSLNSRYMGTAIPTAIGLGAVSKKPIFCVTGDGGSNMYLTEARIAANRSMPICFVIMSDGRYGSIAQSSSELYQDAVNISAPDHRVFETFGIETHQAFSFNSFAHYVDTWDRESPLAIFCSFDQDRYATMTRGLRR
tara:strand:+ start:412250 stop:413509 length:1260 start_codon:yes stop_codon:yes gene_type:complete